MRTSKEGCAAAAEATPECCMCGDSGLSYELFRCKVCQFRSQHRYCSNLYPKAESYDACNWCLSQRNDTTEKAQNSSNSSSSCRNTSEDETKTAKKRNGGNGNHASTPKERKGTLKKLQPNNPIKKQKSPERSPPASATAGRRRITVVGGVEIEDKLRRTRSEEILKKGITKHVVRNKVRRYKLLEEVSS